MRDDTSMMEQGVQMRAVVRSSALGRALVAATRRGICAIFLGQDDGELNAELRARFPEANIGPADHALERMADAAVAMIDHAGRAPVGLPLDLIGTAFQQRVWAALQAIPAGTTSTYAAIARQIGAPQAVRAVGTACGRNPVAVAVPCHRVLRGDGALGGYRWGLARKQRLLERERHG